MTKNDCAESLCISLTKTSSWRTMQASKFPFDTRNALAAQQLFKLAAQCDLTEDQWAMLQPHFNPTDRRWIEQVSTCSRFVCFKTYPKTFDAYVATVSHALESVAVVA